MLLPLLLALQQAAAPAIAPTSPPSGDTVGYWQQRADYRITARLDERAEVLHGVATLTYVNHSPDTLREMYVHQYLNAFRPGSRWSAADEREGRVRFQHMREPTYGYERFTAPPRVNGASVVVQYPFAPDSTVAHFALPAPLAPGDSLHVDFAWDARPSAQVYRRQGRRGRHYDFAQWFPKVAVYDRGGWEPNVFLPAGELYGEFGTFDVTMLVRDDQVIASTGVLVDGDPGWQRARTWGTVNYSGDSYPVRPDVAPAPVPEGYKRVRFVARGVHHFAWSVDPDYAYEGTLYRGRIPVHALFPRSMAGRFGNGTLVMWNVRTLEWLERIYGPYAYPQLTAALRLDPGATEFPMMATYGNPSYGTVLHEVGHIYSYGMLANNEWRSGWLDEGLTEYQSAWAQRLTPQDFAEGAPPPGGPAAHGYRALAKHPLPYERSQMMMYRVDLLGRAQPPGIPAYRFHEFAIYNLGIYSRGAMMYGALRDILGDSGMVAFLHDYYARWQFKHVDELAMRTSAERVCACDLRWFFAQWVHQTGLIDYALGDVDVRRDADGWVTRARVVRRGEFRHPMPVGARTADGWTIARAAAAPDEQWVELRTRERPAEVTLDPEHAVEDWDRRNDGAPSGDLVPDWPFLAQEERSRDVIAVGGLLWYTAPGGLTPALRVRTNYQGSWDRRELGLAISPRAPDGSGATRVQGWATWDDPRLPFTARPVVGLGLGSWMLDGIAKLELRRTWDESPFLFANGPTRTLTLGLTATLPYDRRWIDSTRWDDERVIDARAQYVWHAREPSGWSARGMLLGGTRIASGTAHLFERVEGELVHAAPFGKRGRFSRTLRAFVGLSDDAPAQRSLGASSLDATETFSNHWLRGIDAPLARPDVHYLSPGGAEMRGYSPLVRARNIAALNAQLAATVHQPRAGSWTPRLQLTAFADGAWGSLFGMSARTLADAGVGLIATGMLWDRSYALRVDAPFFVSRPELGIGDDASSRRFRARWAFSLGESF